MKNLNENKIHGHPWRFDLKMKLTTLFLFVAFFQIQANTYSQKTKIDINLENVSIHEALDEIESLTDFKFFFDTKEVDLKRTISIKRKKTTIPIILKKIFSGTDISFSVLNKQIILKPITQNQIGSEKTVEIETAQLSVSGTVTDNAGVPLIGASVLLKGSATGTTTDFDGNFSLTVPDNTGTLVISYLGFATQEIVIADQVEFSIQLQPDTSGLDEVVVTALGIKRQKKSLTYATQNVDLETLDEVRPVQNLVNSLAGKVAGLSIVRSGNGVTGGSRVNLRGNRSIAGSSQPLYVIDGVPIGGDISDISPDDIASISVLKGGNAAALYGSRANNGAIVITTKSGHSGRLSIDFNVTNTFESGQILLDFQDEYGQGVSGTYFDINGDPLNHSVESWGERLTGFSTPHWSGDPANQGVVIPYSANPDRHKDYMQTGSSQSYNIAARSGTETSQLFFGYTYDNKKGIVAGNELKRHNIALKIQQELIDEKLVLDAKVNFIRTDLQNQVGTGGFTNPWSHVYSTPSNIRMQDVRQYEYIDVDGNIRQNYWAPPAGGGNGLNPYWIANRMPAEQFTNRVLTYASLTYNFNDKLSLMVRSAFENSGSYNEQRLYNDTFVIAQDGDYFTRNSHSYDWNSDFLLSYNDNVSEDLTYSINFGGNNRQTSGRTLLTDTNGLVIPNLFAVANARNPVTTEIIGRKEVQSLYGFGQLGYKDALFLDLTYRNDWSSTLPEQNRSFGYYSAGISAVLSDFFEFGEKFNYLKLRGSYAEIGNDTDPFALDRTGSLRIGGLIYLSPTQPNNDLKAEKTVSMEFGFDARFFNSRLGIDFTYYKTNSTDQLFAQDVPLGSGAQSIFINGADIQNTGIEMILTANPIRTDDFSWNITANFSKNNSEVIELAEGIDKLSIGNTAFGFRNMQLTVGSEWGDFYSRGYERDGQGRIIVGSDGLPLTTDGKNVLVSNFSPDWLGGIRNTFRYKDLDLSFLIDIRQGGTVLSSSLSELSADGFLQRTVAGRDGTLIVGQNVLGTNGAVREDGSANNIQVDSEALWKSLGRSEQPIGEAFVESASNIRLRELSLGYTLPAKFLENNVLKKVKLSLVGSNLFFFSNKASFDPEVTIGTETNQEGLEAFAPPLTRSIGFNLKVGF